MTRTIILSTIVAATLMTGLLVGSFPTTFAGGPSAPCPPEGIFVTIVGDDGTEMTYPIDSYTFSTKSDKKKDKNTFMFSHEPDDDVDDAGMSGLSAKILAAIKSGDKIGIHFTACKKVSSLSPDDMFKKHEVWLTGATITETSETPGDDGFPKEKTTGKFKNVERMTSTGPPSG
jgi:hypothetical protein